MILLDTHVLIWLAQDYQRISSAARSVIAEARGKDSALAVCGITLVEIARLTSSGQIHVTPDPASFLREVERRFVVLPITANIALQACSLPAKFPKDPADRIIAATGLIEDIPLVTAEPRNPQIARGTHHLVRKILLNNVIAMACIQPQR